MKELRNLIDRIFFPTMKRSKNWITYRIPYKRPTMILVNFTDISDMVLPNEIEELLAHENSFPRLDFNDYEYGEYMLSDPPLPEDSI